MPRNLTRAFGAALALGTIALCALEVVRSPARGRQVRSRIAEAYCRLPLAFERNVGQADPRARFVARTPGRTTLLTDDGAVLASSDGGLLRMEVVGASPHASPAAVAELAGRVSYLIGNKPSRWLTGVPMYSRIAYRGVYPGVDLVFHGDGRQLEYDFLVAPGADPAAIRVGFRGAEALHVDQRGDLLMTVGGRQERHRRPRAFQRVGTERIEVESAYAVRGRDEIAFQVGAYRRDLPLVIDPVLVFSTFLGGSGSDTATDVTVDSAGNVYVAGFAASGFPTTQGAARTAFAGATWDAFVAKLSPDGSALLYSTYIGGDGNDQALGIAVDAAGHAYVTGGTYSSNFPIVGPVQAVNGGANDAFVTKLSSDGASIVYSTYLGGRDSDAGRGIALDADGNALVVGYASSRDFPTVNAFQPAHAAGTNDYDAFVSKLSADGSTLVYSTYLGGTSQDLGYGIAVDVDGNALVAGETQSDTTFPVANALRGTGQGWEAFLTKIAPAGTVVYSTFFGRSGDDRGVAVAVDSGRNAYLLGITNSDGIATAGVAQTSRRGSFDAFVAEIAPDGSNVVYCTYYGGTSNEFGSDIAVDDLGRAHVVGFTFSTDLPLVRPIQSALNNGASGPEDAFIVLIGPGATAFTFSTYFGGTGNDVAYGVAIGAGRDTFVAGYTQSTDFPTTGALQPTPGGSDDAVVLRVSAGPAVTSVTPSSGGTAGGNSVTISGAGFEAGAVVAFGGSNAAAVTVASDTTISALTPAHASGVVDVVVTNPGGIAGVLPSGFRYTDVPPPSVSGVSPASGPTGGGTVVTITGNGFQDGATVTFGGAATSSVAFQGATSLQTTTPAHAAGAVDVAVTNPDGQSETSAGAFTFVAPPPPPAIASMVPVSGTIAGGTLVTITGSGFQDGATVTFGGVAAPSVAFQSATSLQAATPAHAAGAVDVAVTNPDGQSETSAAAFEFEAPTAPPEPSSSDRGGCGCGAGVARDPSWALLLLLLLPASSRRRVRSDRP